MQFINLLFGFQGRIGRGQLWLAVLVWVFFYVAVVLVAAMYASSFDAILGVAVALYIATMLAAIPIGIKRLHDRNKSGVWMLLFAGFPILTLAAGLAPWSGDPALSWGSVIVQYVGLVIQLWALIELGFLRGSIGNNQYGPDPVAPKLAHH